MKKLIKDELDHLASLHSVHAYKADLMDKKLEKLTGLLESIENNNKQHMRWKIAIVALILLQAFGLLDFLDREVLMSLLLS